MKKIISVAASFALLSLNHSLAQSFDDEGTAYSTAGVEIWTEDEANELVAMPSSFACIIKNTRGDVLQMLPGKRSLTKKIAVWQTRMIVPRRNMPAVFSLLHVLITHHLKALLVGSSR